MTDKLFYSDPYLAEWKAEIKEVSEKNGRILAVLNETAFYPEGGGQPCDRGYVGETKVLEVFEDTGTIYHVLSAVPDGREVVCRLDFKRRFDHMQQHSGEHLLSAVFFNLYKLHNMGFHLGEDCVSIDMSTDMIPSSMLREVEDAANEHIYRNLKVKTYFADKAEALKLPLRKQPKVDEDIRIVEIDGIDYSPCCGTHLATTGEIGLVKIVKTEKYKGMTRVYFKCGNRAFADYRNKHDIVAALCSHFSTNEARIIERVESGETEIKNMSAEIKRLKTRLYKYELAALTGLNNSKVVAARYDDRSFGDIQLMAEEARQFKDLTFILSSVPEKKVVVARSDGPGANCGGIFKENLSRFHGKGGGNETRAQASFDNIEDLFRFEEFLKEIMG